MKKDTTPTERAGTGCDILYEETLDRSKDTFADAVLQFLDFRLGIKDVSLIYRIVNWTEEPEPELKYEAQLLLMRNGSLVELAFENDFGGIEQHLADTEYHKKYLYDELLGSFWNADWEVRRALTSVSTRDQTWVRSHGTKHRASHDVQLLERPW